MKLSVLMSVYYKENPQYLDECLSSLYTQTRPADEIICVKDGALNKGLELVLIKWEQKLPLKIVGYEKNKGLAYALNFGLKYCSGNYIARMDTDDISLHNRFEVQLSYFIENPNVYILGSGITEMHFDKIGNVLEVERFYCKHVFKNSKCLYKGTPIGHPTAMINKTCFNSHSYNEAVGANEDIDLWLSLLDDNYEIINLQECLYLQRFDFNALSRRNYSKAFNECKIYITKLYKMNGFSFLLIYPVFRFLFRLLPKWFIRFIYLSKFREKFLK